MIDDTQDPVQLVSEAVASLRLEMNAGEAGGPRVTAAKAILERYGIQIKTDEEQKRESQERDAALAAAYGLLQEFADIRAESLCLKGELAKSGPAAADHPEG